jgi:O-acetylserine/cysteine efflux transporter
MPQTNQPIAPRDAALLLLIAAIWGVNTAATKYAFLYLPPLFASVLRFTMSATLLMAFWKPAAGTWKPLLLIGLLTATHFGIQAIGMWRADDLSPMVIAMQLWIPASAIFASVFLGERIGMWRIAGIAVAFLGVVVLAADVTVISQLGPFALVGIASIIYGGVSVLVRRGPAVHTLAYQAWIALSCIAVLAPISAVTEHGQIEAARTVHWSVWAALAFGAVSSTIIANAIMFELVKRYEVARTTPYMFLTPVIAIWLGVVWLGDPITPQFLTGCLITMAGVALVALAERRAAPLPGPAE